jgi:hypothetical protein
MNIIPLHLTFITSNFIQTWWPYRLLVRIPVSVLTQYSKLKCGNTPFTHAQTFSENCILHCETRTQQLFKILAFGLMITSEALKLGGIY